jgi:predicted component of type VI protein secretion system
MSGVYDLANLVGGVDVSQVETGVAFDLLDPNNPVYVLPIPGLEEPITLKGKDHKTFKDMLKGLGISFEVEISTGDEDNPYHEVKIEFEKMSDFSRGEIIKKIKSLKRLQQIQIIAQVLRDKAQKDEKFVKLLTNEEQKRNLIAYLEYNIEQLQGKK